MGVLIYVILGYWATGQTIYRNSVLIGTGQAIFMRRVIMGFIFGFVLIPVAIIRLILEMMTNK